jgi:hypothetical protein
MRAAHLTPRALLTEDKTRAYPLAMGPVGDVAAIIKALDVERSPRYQPTTSQTYCNVYAYDVCYLAGVYLPRVWWVIPNAVTEATPVAYAKTVVELNANALYDWLCSYGSKFGWQQVASPEFGQELADAGQVVIVCAARKDRSKSGHIAVIAPQSAALKPAERFGKFVPVQSQAGRQNYCLSCAPGRWWEGAQFGNQFGIWSNKQSIGE